MRAAIFAAMLAMASGVPAGAATFVYVSNAEDGDIGMYTLQPDGSLQPGQRFKAEKPVDADGGQPGQALPLRRGALEAYQAYSYGIDREPARSSRRHRPARRKLAVHRASTARGRFLLGASYGAHLVSVNPVGPDGRVGEPLQTIPTARNAHAIRTDNSNRFVFVPHLGTDQVFQFLFDEKTGRLAANTPPVLQLKQGTGPRHLVVSHDNRFVYLLNELTATVTTLALDGGTGTLKELDSASALPPDSKLGPGAPRGAVGTPGATRRRATPRTTSGPSDLHLTPNGNFLYAAERTSSTIGGFRVDGATGKLTFIGSTPTEKQPRGFAIDPSGRFVVVSGEQSDMIATYAIDADRAARSS